MRGSFQKATLRFRKPVVYQGAVLEQVETLFLHLDDGEFVGLGETAPQPERIVSDGVAEIRSEVESLFATGLKRVSINQVWDRGRAMGISRASQSLLDIAFWDLLGKRARMPLYKIFGLWKPTTRTMATLAVQTPAEVKDRLPELIESTEARTVEVQLGHLRSPEADQEIWAMVQETAKPFNVRLRADCEGRWTPAEAERMIPWLAERDCLVVEQPIAPEEEEALTHLSKNRPVKLYLDQSILDAKDVLRFRELIDGVSLTLTGMGGLTETLRVAGVLRACELKFKLEQGLESSVGVAAAAHIAALADDVQLDLHHQFERDPGDGLKHVAGVVLPRNQPGHGATLKQSMLRD